MRTEKDAISPQDRPPMVSIKKPKKHSLSFYFAIVSSSDGSDYVHESPQCLKNLLANRE